MKMLLAFGKDKDATRGSGCYGDAWRLPLSHEARAKLGKRLTTFGDTRPGVGVRWDGTPDIDWVAIPSGDVSLKGIPEKRHVATFYMARYLVTNAQFDAFVHASDGYGEPKWWKDMAEDANDGPGRQHWDAPNGPRENISWYEAIAFCRWLSHRLGFVVRLPTEYEWQQAATGGEPSNTYPWGPKWDEGRCNTSESHLRQTVAVGLYPAGASTQGVLDLSGNVREWCLSKYSNPADTAIDAPNSSRVVRGGSWSYSQGSARAGARLNGSLPLSRYGSFGFRVVCASPIR